MLRIVPFGLRHIFFSLNSSTRSSSGVIVAHLIVGLVAVFDAQIVVFKVDLQIRQNQLFFDEAPDDPGHLVPIEFDDRGLHLQLCHPRPHAALVPDRGDDPDSWGGPWHRPDGGARTGRTTPGCIR
jgi:hypothetical protein